MSYYLTEMGAAGDETTIVLGGELDMRAAPALRDALRRATERRVKHLIVDLTNATFMDSTAIGALFEASAHVRETGGRLALICTNRNVLRTVEIAGLYRHIAVVPTPVETPQPADTPAAGSKGVRLLSVAQGS
jgi:anti-sigma B factor antagonist